VIAVPSTYSYGDHPHQFAQLHLPPDVARPPVAVVVHGGF
jgi:hypothetical protein